MDTHAGPAWLDGELDPAASAQVEAHLVACPACREALEEWQAVRQWLAAGYALPAEAPGAAWAFWHRLAPQLPERQIKPAPDPAPSLIPVALVLGYALWQGIALGFGFLALPGGREFLAPAWRQIAASALLSILLSGTWWGSSLAEAGLWLSPIVPAGWAGLIAPLVLAIASWGAFAALGALYGAWMLLWLRRSGPACS